MTDLVAWLDVDPWKFTDGGYSQDEFKRYREVCSVLWRAGELTGGITWTLDDGTIMVIDHVGDTVTWKGLRPDPPGEADARAEAASTGLGYASMPRDFKVEVGGMS